MKEFDLTPLIIEKTRSEVLLDLPCGDDESMFFNGYQTWTASYEVRPGDIARSIKPFFRIAASPWAAERYGDAFFMESESSSDCFHGFSYFYKRRGDRCLLIASSDETNGYTIFRYSFGNNRLRITKDSGISLRFDQELHICAFEGSYDEVFDAWFDMLGIKRRPAEPLAGYGSWYNHYDRINEKTIMSDLEGCADILQPGDLFQIDDGWQTAVGDWAVNEERFPRGMKAYADEIHSRGFKAGLWLAPYAAQLSSDLVKEHPEWLLKYDGKPWQAGSNWKGFYSLDIDHPGVQYYLGELFERVLSDWGFDLVKLDFLYAAAPWATSRGAYFGESRGGRMCRAMRYLREWCKDGMILGCGVPLMPAFGQVEYCRIGCDASLDWDNNFLLREVNNEYPSTKNAILSTYYRRGLDNRAFLNDPDVFFLRKSNIKLSEEQKDLHAKVIAQYGSFFLTSDNMGDYDDEQQERYRSLRNHWNKKDLADTEFPDSIKRYK